MGKEYEKPAGRPKLMDWAHLETLWERGSIRCRLFLPFCRVLRLLQDSFPSTRSNRILPSLLMHFAAMTSVMRDLLVSFNLLRRSFEFFVCRRSFSSAILQVSRSQMYSKASHEKKSRCPLKRQPESAP